jgi:putative aminopeptidase FrvX
MFDLLEELIMTPGVSGYEDRIRALISERLPSGVQKTVDNMGNLVATIGEGEKALIFVAHMDELGFVVTEVQDSGFLKIKPLGGTDPRTLFGRVLRIITETGEIKGVVGVKPPHIMADRDKEMAEIPQITDFVVDIGASGREEAEKLGVKILDFGVMEKTFNIINEKFLCARALDDRLGCYILLKALYQLMDEKLSWKVHFAFSVQEEVGIRGSRLLARKFPVDMAFAVDSASSGDIPQARKDLGPAALGKGPALRVMDRVAIIPPAFTKEILAIAEGAKIPCQVIFTGGGTDVLPFQPEGPHVMPIGIRPLRLRVSGDLLLRPRKRLRRYLHGQGKPGPWHTHRLVPLRITQGICRCIENIPRRVRGQELSSRAARRHRHADIQLIRPCGQHRPRRP